MGNRLKIYLGGPMDMYNSLAEAGKVRETIKQKLDPGKFQFFDPVTSTVDRKAYNNNEICQSDLYFLKRSDILLVVVMLPKTIEATKVPIGTLMEVAYARIWDIPVVGVTNCLAGRAWWDYHMTRNFSNLDAALEYIVEKFTSEEVY